MAFSEELVVQPTCGEAAVVSWIPPTGGGHRSTGDCVVALSNKAELFCPKVVFMLQCLGGRIWAVPSGLVCPAVKDCDVTSGTVQSPREDLVGFDPPNKAPTSQN